ncbi:tetratricopeptide repeat protein [Duganella sp. BuS-21]|uniref:tetratricopeptide repeat protein n=1 Tax=Duganella sp. BuS-21 TaxID=2943848 RepID=UPI0035A575F1
MSLINKMLQDLDARGGEGASAMQQEQVKAVPSTERERRPLLLGAAALGVLVLAAGGWYGWQWWQARSAPPATMAKVIDNRVPDKPRFQEPPSAVKAEPSPASAPEALAEAKPEAEAVQPSPAAKPNRAAPATAEQAERGEAAPRKHSAERGDRVARADRAERAESAEPVRPRKAAASAAKAEDGVVLRELTPKQMSENSYRRALAALQEGRVSTALADLDKSVEIDPRNEAARQTYVSLLLENRRTDDAIRQLRLALGVDPRQPGLAMVLARLQLEKGEPALDTLLKTLPYAGNNADYHAFLAGVLQRQQKHADAVEHYRHALQLAPQNGVWWMGLGISLQADQHLPEAREAFVRARGAAGLTPELRAFVERKIEQLSR